MRFLDNTLLSTRNMDSLLEQLRLSIKLGDSLTKRKTTLRRYVVMTNKKTRTRVETPDRKQYR